MEMPEVDDCAVDLPVGIVIIGRNEGERLRQCFTSTLRTRLPIVYVDSGSTDGSIQLAKDFQITAISLDPSRRFSAARARNEGCDALLRQHPSLQAVQFIDGDCELSHSWIPRAYDMLMSDTQLAAVCGRRRESHRNETIYNRLCDMEWDTPIGVTGSFGGDVLLRVKAFLEVGGYDPHVISAEDDDLSVRLRKAQWKLLRIDAEMTTHDAAIQRYGQWWRRAVRTGHAYAQGFAMHGAPPLHHFRKQFLSVLFWTSLLPISLLAAPVTRGISLLLLLAYPFVVLKTTLRTVQDKQVPLVDGLRYGIFCIWGKFPELLGILKYGKHRVLGQPTEIIEYKSPLIRSPVPAPHLARRDRPASIPADGKP